MYTNIDPNILNAIIFETMENSLQNDKDLKLATYKHLNNYAKKDQILFTGSSLMEYFPVCEFYANMQQQLKNKKCCTVKAATDRCCSDITDKTVYNRGIGGYTTDEFLRDIDTMLLDLKPSKVFINIGTNDMNSPAPTETALQCAPLANSASIEMAVPTDSDYPEEPDWMTHLMNNYNKILTIAKDRLPDTDFYLMAYYPINMDVIKSKADPVLAEKFKTHSNEKIRMANIRVAQLAEKHNCSYIDVNEGLYDTNGSLKEEYTVEGVHMYPNAYKVVFENLKKYL